MPNYETLKEDVKKDNREIIKTSMYDNLLMEKKQNKNDEDIKVNEIKEEKNIILGCIEVKNIKWKIQIINSYESVKQEFSSFPEDFKELGVEEIKNEDQIKDCEIFIDNKKIDFTYKYTFPKEGKYIIKYKFSKLLTRTNFMFFDCNNIISLDFSNFNSQNITNMEYMFYDCTSLQSINLSNFKTEKVINMSGLFYNCESLKTLNLSNFNTEKVINMRKMFLGCKSVKSLDLSNFNTEKVSNMCSLFSYRELLESLDLSNFNTSNTTNMESM